MMEKNILLEKGSWSFCFYICPHLFYLLFLLSRRRRTPATRSCSRCSCTRASWWAASRRPCTPCSAPTCCPSSTRKAGTWRRPPPSWWRRATGRRRAPCCSLTAAPTRPSSPSTPLWLFLRSGCEVEGGGFVVGLFGSMEVVEKRTEIWGSDPSNTHLLL